MKKTYTSENVWAIPNSLLNPNYGNFPDLFDSSKLTNDSPDKCYQGIIDGSNEDVVILNEGPINKFSFCPKVIGDPDRRALHRAEWIKEFFKTDRGDSAHGFEQVGLNHNIAVVPIADRDGFACYSFIPKSDVPLKVIVLDDTQREDDGSVDIHAHGCLDATRWAWLKAELKDGQDNNQLMIIAAHIPIAVANIGTEMEWWQHVSPSGGNKWNAVTLKDLITTLQDSTNLLMWISGHRHYNHVKAFVSPDPKSPEKGFWQVETSSLRDFPQQFRTFEIFLNKDYSVSIEAVNVDPAFAEGTPAAKSRINAIAAQQIAHNDLTKNLTNSLTVGKSKSIVAMDPTRTQGNADDDHKYTDDSIRFEDMSKSDIPYNASSNVRLFKQLSAKMKKSLKEGSW